MENTLRVYETYCPTRGQKHYVPLKRFFDIILSGTMLVLLSPIFFLSAAAIKLDSHGPVLFRQKRVGRNGRKIIVYKFRSMDLSAPKNRSTASLRDSEKYITRVGRILRKTSLDEIPQLINILRGDMSIIGPRPLIPQENDVHEMRYQNGVYFLRPGLTGLAQVNGRDLVSPEEKVRYDTEYLHTFSWRKDISIFFETICKVFRRDGVVEGSEQVAPESFEQAEATEPADAKEQKRPCVSTGGLE
ncbi:MAG: sugar transferase [Clostridiales bacterium]|nr:sugar transferase [Clostridiales bacterium]